MAVLLAACASTPVSDAELFRPSATQAKVFVYVVYDDPDGKPFFPETFRFHVTGFDGEIDDSKFVRTGVEPGTWSLSVDEVDWGGNVVHTTVHKAHLQAGKLYFYPAHITAAGEVHLVNTGSHEGVPAVKARVEDCNC